MTGTDVAQDQAKPERPEDTTPASKRSFMSLLKIWLPFPVILGVLLFFQFRTGNLEKTEAPPAEESAAVFEGAGAELPLLLQALQDERRRLENEWEDLRFAERRVLVEKGEIDERRAEVEKLLERVDARVRVMEEERDGMLAQLARVYETMKPDAAAVILGGLEVETSTEIIRRMKERNAAQVMASLEPQAAARISQRMLRSRP